jgi:hypothetical protein
MIWLLVTMAIMSRKFEPGHTPRIDDLHVIACNELAFGRRGMASDLRAGADGCGGGGRGRGGTSVDGGGVDVVLFVRVGLNHKVSVAAALRGGVRVGRISRTGRCQCL